MHVTSGHASNSSFGIGEMENQWTEEVIAQGLTLAQFRFIHHLKCLMLNKGSVDR